MEICHAGKKRSRRNTHVVAATQLFMAHVHGCSVHAGTYRAYNMQRHKQWHGVHQAAWHHASAHLTRRTIRNTMVRD